MEDRRRFTRYPVYCPIQYKCQDDQPREATVTMNLSEGGALISTHRELSVPAPMIVKIVMKNEEFYIRSRVVHIQYGQDSGLYNVGVEFIDTPREFRERFFEELEAIMLYQRQFQNETGAELSLAEASVQWFKERGRRW